MATGSGVPGRTVADFRRRFRSLAVGEAVNVVWLPLVFLVGFGVPAGAANLTGLGLLVLLLAEGSAYWVVKIVQLDRGLPHPPGIAVFARLRVANVVLLAAGLVVTATAAAVDPGAATLPGLGFTMFAVGEHVNYFHVQLVPTPRWGRRWLRPARLARDLAAVR